MNLQPIKKIVLTLATLAGVISCASNVQLKSGIENATHFNRDIASEDIDCFTLVKKIIVKDSGSGKYIAKDVERRFTRSAFSTTDLRRRLLEEWDKRYKKIDSLLDYQSKADIPIKDFVKVVRKSEDGLLAKIMMIRRATKSIDLTYYIFDDSLVSRTILHELRLAAKRGVKIRILYDSFGSRAVGGSSRVGISEDLRALASLSGRPILGDDGLPTGKFANIEIMQFNPAWKPGKMIEKFFNFTKNLFSGEDNRLALDKTAWNNRSHDKMLLIDAEDVENSMLITGGRNISQYDYSLKKTFAPDELESANDFEVILRGSTYVSEDGSMENKALDQFNRIYYARANLNFSDYVREMNDQLVEELSKRPEPVVAQIREIRKKQREELKRLRAAKRKVLGSSYTDADGNTVTNPGIFQQRLKQLEDEGFLDNDFELAEYKILHEVQNLTGKPTFLKPFARRAPANPNSIEKAIFELLLSAKESMTIVSPYFWIGEKQTLEIIEWLKADPTRKFTAISNSFLTTDSLISQVVVEDAYQRMNKLFLKHGVAGQVELKVLGKEDHEFLSPTGKEYGFLHAKIYIADEKRFVNTTSNLDLISRLSNSEIGVQIDFLEKNSSNLAELKIFLAYLRSISTDVNSQEYQRMIANPRASGFVKKLAIYKALITRLGLLHLL